MAYRSFNIVCTTTAQPGPSTDEGPGARWMLTYSIYNTDMVEVIGTSPSTVGTQLMIGHLIGFIIEIDSLTQLQFKAVVDGEIVNAQRLN